MRTLLALLVVAVASPAVAEDVGIMGRSQLGGAGLQRVRSAEIAPSSLGVGATVGFFRTPSVTQSGGVDEYHLTTYGAFFVPVDFLELSVSARSATLQNQASPRGYYFLVNDLFVRGKLGFQPARGLWIGAELNVRVPPPAFISQPFYKGLSPGIIGMLSYDFRGAGAPLVFHVNTGFTLDNSVDFRDQSGDISRDFALAITTYNRWTSAAALEGRFDVKGFGIRPYLEYEIDVALGAAGPIPMRLVPGLRLLPWRGSWVDVAVEVGLTRPTAPGVLPIAPWQLMIGLGYQLDYGAVGGERVVEKIVEKEVVKPAPKAPLKAAVRGTVRDEKTLKALKDAIIAMPGRSRILTDELGNFAATELPPGPVKLGFTSPGYAPGEFQGKVEAGESLELELTLEPLPPEPPASVRVRGTVMSEKDKPVAATVAVTGAGVSTKAGANGEYELVVPAGEAGVDVAAPGFLTQGKRVQTRPGDSVVLDFVLKEVPKTQLVVLTKQKIEIKKQVHFATDKDVILPDSTPLLDEVASTILSNDRLRLIRIEGHTDAVGDDAHNLDLSQRRAQSVMRSLLERGIEPVRLKAIGYGETKPIGDNKTAKGKAQNRRVEFMIEAQD